MSTTSAGSIFSVFMPSTTRASPLQRKPPPRPAVTNQEQLEIPDWILIPVSLGMLAVYLPLLPIVWIYVSGKLRKEAQRERNRRRAAETLTQP